MSWRIRRIMDKDKMQVVGLMSGTSADGVDVALVEITERKVRLLAFDVFPYTNALRKAILDLIPDAERFQRSPGISSRRDVLGVTHGQPALRSERARERHAALDACTRAGGARRDQHQPVAEQIAARACLEPATSLEIIHPCGVGGNEYRCRRAAVDLPRERRAARIRRQYPRPGMGASSLGAQRGAE